MEPCKEENRYDETENTSINPYLYHNPTDARVWAI